MVSDEYGIIELVKQMPGRYTYEEEDGTEVTINYDAEGLDLVPVTMTLTYDPSDEQGWTDFRSSYHWDGDAGEWVGDDCSYRSIGYHHFDFTYGHGQPLMSYYEDSYDFDLDDDDFDSSVRFLSDLRIAYHWDATAKSFVEDRRYGIVYTPEGDDELSFINYDTTDGSPFTGSYKRDAQGRLVQKTQMVMYPDGRNLPVTYTYTYDPQNYMLTMQEEAGDGVTTLETYTYERRTITVTGIDELRPDATAELTIQGLTLSAPGQRLSLYDLQGAPVTKGTGSVTAPRPEAGPCSEHDIAFHSLLLPDTSRVRRAPGRPRLGMIPFPQASVCENKKRRAATFFAFFCLSLPESTLLMIEGNQEPKE